MEQEIQQSPQSQTPLPTDGSKKLLPIIVFVIIAVLIIGTGAYFLSNKFQKQETNDLLPSETVSQDNGQSQQENISTPTQQNVSTPINENLEADDFAQCIRNGGKNVTPNFNAPKTCILNDKYYRSDCVSNDKYFVVQQSLPKAETNILVKYKTTKDQKYACEYLVDDYDFQIKNEWTAGVFALENDFLILDSGSGPEPRELIVYDLTNRKRVYTDHYSTPVAINNNTITYWSPENTKPDETNCPKITEYTSYGLGAEIEARIVLTLSTLNKNNLGEYRCSATQ